MNKQKQTSTPRILSQFSDHVEDITFPRRRLSFEPRTPLTGFIDLGWTVIFLQICPDEVEVALEGSIDLSGSCMDGIVNGLKELSNLVDAE